MLAHFSVDEYLISERSRQGRAAQYSMQDAVCNEVIAKSCLGYHLQFQQPESLSAESIQEFKLAQYSARFWISHARVATQRTETWSQLAMELLSTRNDAYLNWTRIYDPDRPSKEPQFGKAPRKVLAPLYYAACSGLTKVRWMSTHKVEASATHSRRLHIEATSRSSSCCSTRALRSTLKAFQRRSNNGESPGTTLPQRPQT